MKSLGCITTFSVFLLVCSSLRAAPKERVVTVKGPTVVAFFVPVTKVQLSKDPDTNEALLDFQYYAARTQTRLHDAGIDFEVIHASSFGLKSGAKTRTFHPEVKVGYYFVEPGKSPLMVVGVNTDSDVFKIATGYFGLASK